MMRSSSITQVGPKYSDRRNGKRSAERDLKHTNTEGRRPHEETEVGVMQPQAEERLEPGRQGSILRDSKAPPTNTLISDFWPPKL